MRVRGVKARVRQHGGEVTDVGYVTVGRAKEAHVEAYFEDSEAVPEFNSIELCDRVTIDREWDAENNGVMFEVRVADRDGF